MKYFGVTDKGLVRAINQDNYVIAHNENGDVFAMVCDGIGGAFGGEIASKMAVEYFAKIFSEHTGFKDMEDIKTWTRYHVIKCNEAIYRFANSDNKYKGMGTTLTGVLLTSVGKCVVNVGDSRVYGFMNDEMIQLTEDHTLINDMLKHNEITKEMAANHPQKHVITNAMGVWNSIKVDLDERKENFDYLLLCSDGLFGYVDEKTIKEILFSPLTSTLKTRKLLNYALRGGGGDNITLILIDLQER